MFFITQRVTQIFLAKAFLVSHGMQVIRQNITIINIKDHEAETSDLD